MSRYYYFVATLPTLELGSPAPMTSAEFLERSQRFLAAEDFAVIHAATLISGVDGPPPACAASPLLTGYYSWERSVRNELVRLRARRLERAADPWIRSAGRDDAASRAAQAAFQASHPLEAELILERERWERIRTLRSLHFFDLELIAAYRLELQIIERLARLRDVEGEKRYRATYAAILGSSQSTESGAKQ